MMKNLFFCIVFASLSLFAFAVGQTASASRQGSGHESLPMGYGNIKLGMSVDEVKSELLKNHAFGYRGDRDVSFSPKDNQVLIETETRFHHPVRILLYGQRCVYVVDGIKQLMPLSFTEF